MDGIINILREIPIATLLGMAIMLWIFYERIGTKFDKKFDGLRSEMKEMKNELKFEIKDLSNHVNDVDRRLSRIEGSIMTQECCALKNNQLKKAE